MHRSRLSTTLAVAALLTCLVAGAIAQHTAPAPIHRAGLLARLKSKMSGGSHNPMGHPSVFGGRIIGNKNSHVYHLPGDKGTLPAEKNRVYFHTEAEAKAAGYHLAGQPKMGGGKMMNNMHGGAMHHATGSFKH